MDLLLDFERMRRWAFGAKDESPELKDAVRRWVETMQPRARKHALLNERNNVRQLDRHRRVWAIRNAVRAKESDLRAEGRTEYGLRTLALTAVAKARGENVNKVRKLFYAKDVPDPDAA